MKNWLLVFGISLAIVSWLWVLAPQAQAVVFTSTGNPDDTASGEVVTALATAETLNYTDINDNPKPQVTPVGDIAITVLPVYGFSYGSYRTPQISDPSLSEAYGYPGQTRWQYLSITNEGNTSDTYTLASTAEFGSAGSGTWVVEVHRTSDDYLIASLEVGSPTTIESVNVAEDAEYSYYYKVTPPFLGTPNPDAQVTTNVYAGTSSTPVGRYTGANGLTYGGVDHYGPGGIQWKVACPSMEIVTRVATVDAPNVYLSGGGDIHDAVPGAIITHQITYRNTGNCSAENVVVSMQVIGKLAHINKTGSTDHVVLTMPTTNPGGDWSIYYNVSEAGTPNFTYGNHDGWTLIGTLDAIASNYFPSGNSTFTCVPGASAEARANYIKLEKQYVDDLEDDKNIYLGFSIR